MKGIISIQMTAVLFFSGLVLAGQKWEKTNYSEWSLSQVYDILLNSSWVELGGPAPHKASCFPAVYRVRLLSSRPIREAILRLVSLTVREPTIDVKDLAAPEIQMEQARLRRFLASETGKLVTQAEDGYVIICMTLKISFPVLPYPFSQWPKNFPFHQHWFDLFNEERLPEDPSDIDPNTSLSTNTGRNVSLIQFIPPQKSRLGALFLFPRNLAEGRPLIRTGDRRLRFKTKVKGAEVGATFSLSKMVYKGNLEF
jgi:hypothetical protein